MCLLGYYEELGGNWGVEGGAGRATLAKVAHEERLCVWVGFGGHCAGLRVTQPADGGKLDSGLQRPAFKSQKKV